MDYNKLKDKINSSYGEIKIFFEKEGDSIEFTAGGFYQAIRNDSLKISMLEKISNKLDIPMSFWFEIPGKTIIPSSTNKDGIMYEKIIQDYLDDKRRMKMEIDELKEKLEKYEGKKKEAI